MSPHEMIRHLTRCRRCMGRGVVDVHCTNLDPPPGIVHFQHPARRPLGGQTAHTWCGRVVSVRTTIPSQRPRTLTQVTCRDCLSHYHRERRSPGAH